MKAIDLRNRNLKLNVAFSLFRQFVALVCGFIIPGLMIKAYGSEAYGATASITQFLGYITLLESGIGGVARAALYKHLNSKNVYDISCVVNEIKRFFRAIGYIFLAYVFVLTFSFYYIGDVKCFDWITTAWLVLVISISTFAEYFIGISYGILLQAAQKGYITQSLSIFTTVLNTALIITFVYLGMDLIWVKLVSSCVFLIKPIFLRIYVSKKYNIIKHTERNKKLLDQKWTGMGQHLSYFLHNNTDVAVLTIFADLKCVAIYAVHNMVVSQIQNIATSFANGQEALFGDLIAGKENDELQKRFNIQETVISLVCVFLFSVTAVLINPFIKLYTAGVSDTEYINPVFALVLVLAGLVHCLRSPYHSVVIAAGHFKQTRLAAYGEAAINIVFSCVLVFKFSLVGVAIATLIATAFRFCYYAVYLSKNILYQPIAQSCKRFLCNSIAFFAVLVIGNLIINYFEIKDYFMWIIAAIAVSVTAITVIFIVNLVFFRDNIRLLLSIKQKYRS